MCARAWCKRRTRQWRKRGKKLLQNGLYWTGEASAAARLGCVSSVSTKLPENHNDLSSHLMKTTFEEDNMTGLQERGE